VAAAANHNGGVLTVPVMNEGAAEPADTLAAETGSAPFGAAPQQLPRQDAIRPERVPAAVADAAETPAFRPAHADAPAKTFDVATTRRRPVVFEEDDDLDVPDFLK
jgi:cell division protein FtsZ